MAQTTLDAPDLSDGDPGFALKVLGILFFTGFGIVATAMSFVFFAPAGVVLAALVAWLGFHGMVWDHDDFALRVLSMLGFTAFAVVATAMAFAFIAPAGVLLAAVFLWRGFAGFGFARDRARLVPPDGFAGPAPSGNAAFDAFKSDTLRRLEDERVAFEGFLDRLRGARDKSEFDQFMEDRVARARAENVADTPSGTR